MLIVPSNVFDASSGDINSVATPGLSDNEQAQLMIEDSAIDAYSSYCQSQATDPKRIKIIRVSESFFFWAYAAHEQNYFQELDPEVEIVVFPCSILDNHRGLMVYDVRSKKTVLMDPYVVPTKEMLQRARLVLRGFFSTFRLENSENKLTVAQGCRHQQENTNNCGAHVSLFVHQICQGQPIKPVKDIIAFRRDMRAAILQHIQARSAVSGKP